MKTILIARPLSISPATACIIKSMKSRQVDLDLP
jgi:hypothetical protein